MKTLTQTFEEILKNLDPEGKNYPEVFNNLVNAVKARDEEVVNVGLFTFDSTEQMTTGKVIDEIEYRIGKIKQKMEETL